MFMEKVLKLVSEASYKAANRSVNSASIWYLYQEKESEAVRKLRKNNK